ncbi:uncharacterized protein LOC118407263 [Branchiostoma floridae]|uniref:Uncharacterized protein LOC118407263 n=1 Tax=Branchiostoma floridae TaxID=7739 RepID=A0A9J7HT61_BRAFL|nr:uncharacterized protein LOC118407263 [Branchiostoma floridae]
MNGMHRCYITDFYPFFVKGLTPAINEVDPAATTEDVVVSLPAVIPEGTSEPSEVAGNGKETKNDDAPCETDTGKHTDNVENANSGENVPNGDVRTTAEREIPIHDNWDSAAQADNQGQGDCGMDEEEDKEETSTPGLNVVIDIHVETAPEEPKESADDTPPHMDPGFSATQMVTVQGHA